MGKRTYEEAFGRRYLNKVLLNDYYVKIDMFKVLHKEDRDDFKTRYNIRTMENNNFLYDEEVIKKRSKSATSFNREEALTKTELMELFSNISVHDVWSAEYKVFDKSKEWQNELAKESQSLTTEEAGKYIKKKSKSFGKVERTIIAHKITTNSKNNYYTVRDLEIHFNCLNERKTVEEAQNQSIRNLDVNTIQYLRFNGVKYVLKI